MGRTIIAGLLMLIVSSAAHGQLVDQGMFEYHMKDCGCVDHSPPKGLRDLMEAARAQVQPPGATPLYTFYPHAGIFSEGDLDMGNYTDLDPSSPGILDPYCTDITYDGHTGIDTGILYWDMQDIGVPIFAALPGTVIVADDGAFDRNTTLGDRPDNKVFIDHGNGHITRYHHMKKDSVLVNVNDVVVAGQQIGSVGSSGSSTGPHLHFETRVNNVHIEPFAGLCGPSQSCFLRQGFAQAGPFIRELTLTEQNLNGWSGPPVSTSSKGSFLINTTPVIYTWINLVNMEANSTYKVRYLRPDGSVAIDGGDQVWNFHHRWVLWWWAYGIHLDQVGQWTLELTINGEIAEEAPFDVVATAGELANRAPYAQYVGFENPPAITEVPVCRVARHTIVDDPDYDLVRFRWHWKVNGVTRRDVTTAAWADALPQNEISTGDTLTCEVTPSDGSLSGTMRSVTSIVTATGGMASDIAVEQPAATGLTDEASLVSYGEVGIGGSSPRVFTIRNTGTGVLTGLAAEIDGADAARFHAGAFGATQLNPGASTTFTVTYSPTAVGADTAELHIVSNDLDELPFDIDLAGNGSIPEIVVEFPFDTELTDGASSIDFGNALIGAAVQRTLRIRNTGTGSLTGLAASFNGADGGMFSAGAFGSTTLAPGASTTVTISFSPTNLGAKTAALHIASNDADENPFDITLTGAGTGPEITVEQPAGNDLVDGTTTINFGSANPGAPASRSFTVRNDGTAPLTGLAVSIDGTHGDDYSAGVLTATSLNAGQSATFSVTFTPDAAGTRSASLHIASNDLNENPFDLELTAISLDPDIAVEQPVTVPVSDGGARAFGPQNLGGSASQTYTIRNTGTAPLTGLALDVSGPHSAEFVPTALPATTLAPGMTMPFDVTFTPLALGSRNASISINNNDRDENPYNIALSGVGTLPEIVVEQPIGTELIDGTSQIDFGDTPLAGNIQRTFRIRNVGTGPLKGLALTVDGAHSAEFVPEAMSGADLVAGGTRDFTVTFSPSVVGARMATLQIASNDGDENPFEIALHGSAQSPDIQVFVNAVEVQDGSSVRLDDLIGSTPAALPISVQIRNNGVAALVGLESSKSGPDAGDFVVGGLGGASLIPGETLNINALFNPGSEGDKTATIHIASNDPDENPFDITLLGSRLAPTTLEDFADDFGLTGDARLPNSDGDGDNVTLLEEYAFNLDPTVADSGFVTMSGESGLPRITLEDVGGGVQRLRVEFIQRRNDPALSFHVEFGDSPANFSPAANAVSTTLINPTFKRGIVVDSETTATQVRRFGQVRLSYQPMP